MEKIYFTVMIEDINGNFIKKGLINDIVIDDINKFKNIGFIEIGKVIEKFDCTIIEPYILICDKKVKTINYKNRRLFSSYGNKYNNLLPHIFYCNDEESKFKIYNNIRNDIISNNKEQVNIKVKK